MSLKLSAILLGLLFVEIASAKAVQRHIPLAFEGESGQLRTSVCALVTEHAYDDKTWWKSDVKSLDARQRVFRSVVDAILRKDKRALVALSAGSVNSEQGRQQVDIMVNFSDLLKSIEATHVYEVAPLLIVYARLNDGDKTGLGTFVFLKQASKYSLLPVRPKELGYALVRDWAESGWGLRNSNGPGYCSSEEIARANHRVIVESPANADIRVVLPVDLHLDPAFGKKISGGTASRVIKVYGQMREAARKGNFAGLLSFGRPGEAKEIADFPSNPQLAGQREALKATLLDEEPAGVVDGGPLQVLYTRAKDGNSATVWYFIARGSGDPQWANFARLARLDSLFKSGPLFDAAITDPTFEKLRKQPTANQ